MSLLNLQAEVVDRGVSVVWLTTRLRTSLQTVVVMHGVFILYSLIYVLRPAVLSTELGHALIATNIRRRQAISLVWYLMTTSGLVKDSLSLRSVRLCITVCGELTEGG